MKRYNALLALAISLCSVPSWGAEIKMRGFASFVGGYTGGGDEQYRDYDNHVNLRPNSLVALQFDADLEDNLSATVQFLSKGSNNYEPNVEWAYMTYKFNDSVQLSAGKIRIPFYRFSDFLDVRYAYNWLEAPRAVYDFDFAGYDGLSLVHTAEFAGWDSSLQVIFGQFNGEISGSIAKIEDLTGFNWVVTRDWLTLRAGYVASNTEIDVDDFNGITQLIDGFGAQTPFDLSNISRAIKIDSDSSNYTGLAVGIDHFNVLIDLEYTEYEIDNSLIPRTKANFISLGYRADKFIPYVVFSEQTAKPEDHISGMVPAAIAQIPIAQIGGATLPQFLAGAVAATEVKIKDRELGLRYDFHHSAALKMSYLKREELGKDDVSIMRVGIDLIF